MEEFVRHLLQAQGVSDELDPEVRRHLELEVMDRAENFINQRLLDAMDDDTVQRFNKLLDDPDAGQEQVQAFVAENVPNMQQVVNAAMVSFQEIYLGLR